MPRALLPNYARLWSLGNLCEAIDELKFNCVIGILHRYSHSPAFFPSYYSHWHPRGAVGGGGGMGEYPSPPPKKKTRKFVVEKWLYFPGCIIGQISSKYLLEINSPLRFSNVNPKLFSQISNLHWFFSSNAQYLKEVLLILIKIGLIWKKILSEIMKVFEKFLFSIDL